MRLLSRDKTDRPSIAEIRNVLAPEIPKGSTQPVLPDPPKPPGATPWRLLGIGAASIVLALGFFYRCPLLGMCEKVPISISVLDQNGLDVPNVAFLTEDSKDTLFVSTSLGASMFQLAPNRRVLRLVEVASTPCYRLPETYEITAADFDQERAVIRVEKTCSDKPNVLTLLVVSTKGARISIDGRDTGKRAPYGFPGIQSGEHRLSLTMPGFDGRDTVIVLSDTNDTTVVAMNLRKTIPDVGKNTVSQNDDKQTDDQNPAFSKTYQFSTSPMVAEVYVDGETTNSADAFGKFNRELSAGRHTFRVKVGGQEAVLYYMVPVGDPNGILVLDYADGQVKASQP